MEENSKILIECIANAKAVRDASIVNACSLLKEEFSAGMTKALAGKLREEAVDDEVDVKTDTPTNVNVNDTQNSSTDITTTDSTTTPKNVVITAKTDLGEPLSVNGVPPEKQNSDKADVSATTDTPEDINTNSVDTNTTPDNDTSDNDETLDSNELDEILKELADDASEKDVDINVTSDTDENKKCSCGDKPSERKDVTSNDDETEEDISLEDILAEIENELEKEEDDEDVPYKKHTGTETYDECDHLTSEDLAEALIHAHEQNKFLTKALNEHKNVILKLRGYLAETKLLNSKLLYTNKLFKGKNLTESQKMKIINTFDLAKTDREVKIAYTVLAESLNIGGSVVSKKRVNTTVSSITEGLASKPVASTKPSEKIINESSSKLAQRFRQLAGING